MSDIHESLTVRCPFEDILGAAKAFVVGLPIEDGASVCALRARIGDLTVERRADLTIVHRTAAPGYEIMEIAWSPHDGGPYPTFRGTLSAEEGGATFCRLDLDGGYEPPFGVAGVMFDAVVGHRIAVAAARALLDEIKTGVERAYRRGTNAA
jgi:hypothetical protein